MNPERLPNSPEVSGFSPGVIQGLESVAADLNEAVNQLRSEDRSAFSAVSLISRMVLDLMEVSGQARKNIADEYEGTRGADRHRIMSEAFDSLSLTHHAGVLVKEAEYEIVDELRCIGATWDEIADTIGTTRQTAHYRFSRTKPTKSKSD